MGHIIFDDDLYRITLSDGEWVDVLSLMPKYVRDEAVQAAGKTRGKMERGEENPSLEMELDSTAMSRVIRQKMIKAWSFTDKQGKAIPVTKENIDRMDEQTADFIVSEIDKLNAGRTKAEKKG
ncbi:MAG: hypothetical protein KJ604_20925 [Gammaproteobacteria bacterium]|nr:hypothetical protein [Gammaproteobacteria bacterium]